MMDPTATAEVLGALITSVSITWGLQSYLVWRAVDRPGRSRSLAVALVLMTVLAVASLICAVAALHVLALQGQNATFARLYNAAMWVTGTFVALVATYYLLVLLDYAIRPEK